jgi:hypothetical protein
MSEKRITVWVQRFQGRKHLMLQWLNPETGKRKSRSAQTDDPKAAEQKRADLEYDLNHGKFQEASRLTWQRFRELFEDEYVAAKRQNTRENYDAMFKAFERICSPKTLKGVNERTISLFAAGLRKEPGRAKGSVGQAPSTIRQRLHAAHGAGVGRRTEYAPGLAKVPRGQGAEEEAAAGADGDVRAAPAQGPRRQHAGLPARRLAWRAAPR